MSKPSLGNQTEFANYLAHLWTSIKNRPGAILINATDCRTPYEPLQTFLSQLEKPPVFYATEAADGFVANPYFPFLDVVRENLGGKGIKKALDNSQVYSYQRGLFEGFLGGAQPKRLEGVIREELLYEKTRLHAALTNLLVQTSDLGLVLFIGSIHLCPRSTFDFVRVLLDSEISKKLMVVMTYDRNYLFRNEELEKEWSGFFQYLEVKSFLLDLNDGGTNRAGLCTEMPRPYLVLDETQPLQGTDLKLLLGAAQSAFKFLAYNDSRTYAQRLYDIITKHNLKISDQDYTELIYILGDSCNNLDDSDSALIYYNTLLQKLQKDSAYGEIGYLYHKMALINHYKDNHDIALKLSNQSIKLTEKYGDDLQKAMAHFTQLICETDLVVVHERFKSKYNTIFTTVTELLKKNEFHNHLAYLLSLATYILSLLQYGFKEEAFGNCREGIRIAERDNNVLRLATANHIEGMLYQELGDWESALISYKKSQNLRLQLEDYIELARSCNGIGYFFFTIENYTEAHNYYLQALEYLQKSEDKDYTEICATLFNISVIYYFSFKYEMAIDMLEKLSSIMYALKIENLPYTPSYDIWSLTGLSYLLNGNRIKAFEYIKKIASHPKIASRETESEYFEFFKGLFYYDPENYETSNIQLRWSIAVIRRSKRAFGYLLMHIFYTFGSLLQTQGNQAEVRKLVQEGLDYATGSNFTYHRGLLKSLLNRLENPIQQFTFNNSAFNHKPILQELRHLQDMNRLHKRMEEINFLYTVQNTLGATIDTDDLTGTVCRLIETEFSSEIVTVATIETSPEGRRNISLTFTDQPEQAVIDSCTKLVDRLAAEGKDVLVPSIRDSAYNEFAGQFSSAVFIPLKISATREMAILCGAARDDFTFTISDHRILSIAAKQMWTTMERINLDRIIREKNTELEVANSKLKKAAITDGLTDLFNKDELFKRLAEEMRRSKRYYKKDAESFSVVFIDLDNFKYCNDTFGHTVGDIVLKEFADLIKKNIRDVDYGFRYGGDEFVVLLSHTDKEGAVVVVRRIFRDLAAMDYFIPVIAEKTGGAVEIPADKRLGCSIGVSCFKIDENKSVDEILNEADMALYSAKRGGKNGWRVFGADDQ